MQHLILSAVLRLVDLHHSPRSDTGGLIVLCRLPPENDLASTVAAIWKKTVSKYPLNET